MSPTKRTSTTKRTSKKPRNIAWLTTWQDTPGIRHQALAMKTKDPYLIDVFTPCEGYAWDVLDNTGTEMTVTCVFCLHSKFKDRCEGMNLEAIEHLDEAGLIANFNDHEALAVTLQDNI